MLQKIDFILIRQANKAPTTETVTMLAELGAIGMVLLPPWSPLQPLPVHIRQCASFLHFCELSDKQPRSNVFAGMIFNMQTYS